MGSSRHAMSLTVLALFAGMGLPLTARAQAPQSGAAAGGLSPDGPAQVSSDAAPAVGAAPAASAAPAAPAAPATPAAAAAPAPALGTPEGAAEDKPAAPGDADEAAVANEWVARDTSLNEANTITGGTGLLRTQHAQSGAPAQFRLGIISEWYTGGFLCTAKFPCLDPSGAQNKSDSLNHFGGTISLGTSLFKIGEGTFEAYASTEAIANSDAANRPALLQVFGDTNLAVKYGAPVGGDVMHLGLFTELWLINGTGSVGLAGKGTSAKFGGIATADMRGLESPVPLRMSLNVVYSVDNTGTVVTDTENARAAAAGSTSIFISAARYSWRKTVSVRSSRLTLWCRPTARATRAFKAT
jgi:hypothetical protein